MEKLMQKKVFRAVNWNRSEDDYTKDFWDQNVSQMWTDDEIPLSDDKTCWDTQMSETEKNVYKHVLGGLTLLDTIQGGVGMPKILDHVDGLQRKAVLAFMSMMEQIHAKSYSSIFSTVASNEEIDYIFNWVEKNPFLQKKASIVSSYYENIHTQKDLYMALVASVFLESYLFYSGFFYPLFLAGQGRMTNSGEIIKLILRDESVHGVYGGVLAQEIFETFPEAEQVVLMKNVYQLLEQLYENEKQYTEELYHQVGLQEEVLKFVRFNANKALMNLGMDTYYEEEEINPIVLNGIRNESTNHDFFSQKGNSYSKATNVVKLKDEDFKFEIIDEFAS